ncbi:hypothetical protein D9758_006647 [Tetrapyrgos nigripes]|uniref:Septation protein imp2 n=1 Tax=Tetrapyrgos nigripes TaxID=182062 RepID=A0A8H5GJB4_9AGAR|nr:hypothetical protein D9758_006647 [Tetrapyrgos nigripes]
MTARRQPSTTSLSKYMRAGSPVPMGKSTDFCNAFWGPGDGGVDVLFARMRGAMRTMDELRNFWKERAAIEEDYAKRLAKLSKFTLGRDEIGELRNSLDTIRLETDKQSSHHLNLAHQIKNDLEAQTNAFCQRQANHKKVYQGVIEKEFKNKQTQESYVMKAKEKYEQDCMRINSYTAQSTLVQGKDLEKIQYKLERAQQTVQANERDFANFSRAFQDTAAKWEQDWKTFCDTCQDMEDERLEFMKDNMWAYANAVSTVCVADDESCEKLRVALEQMEFDREMENFVRDYGTGNQIPGPPTFVNYNKGESPRAPTNKSANFIRSSQRSSPLRVAQTLPPEEPPEEEEAEPVNTAGRGAGGGNRNSIPESSSARPTSQASNVNGVNGHQSTPSNASSSNHALVRKSTNMSYRHPPPDPMAETIDPTAETFIKVGENAYKVDLSNNSQRHSMATDYATSPISVLSTSTADDPLARQLEELRNQVASGGNVRRNSTWRGQGESGAPAREHIRRDSLAAPGSSRPSGSSPSPSPRDYRNSAEMVVGAYPGSSPSPRPTSPNTNGAPTAAFMVPKKPVSPGADVIEGVLSDYHQSLPGERKSMSQSRRGSFVGSTHAPSPSVDQNLARPSSQMGHAGIGAHGGSRSNSPQPISRSTSPAPSPGQYMSTPASGSSANVARGNSMHRSPSPNTMGIALGPDGRVIQDEMATRYQQSQAQQPPQQQQQYRSLAPQAQVPPPPNSQYAVARTGSYSSSFASVPPPPTHIPPQSQPPYAQPPQAPYGQPPPSTQPAYAVPPPPIQQPQQPSYSAPPPPHYNPPPPQQQQQQYGQPTHAGGYGSMNNINGGGSYYGSHSPNQGPSPSQQQPRSMHSQQTPGISNMSSMSSMHSQQGSGGYHQAAYQQPQQQQMRRSPSPQPPMQQGQLVPGSMGAGQVTDDGSRILFYVQALYDYNATIDEEFDFQAGDIIAVTATPDDGWWSGQLLDEERRIPGKHVFPSNFARLF